jgi:hypothetical protein
MEQITQRLPLWLQAKILVHIGVRFVKPQEPSPIPTATAQGKSVLQRSYQR